MVGPSGLQITSRFFDDLLRDLVTRTKSVTYGTSHRHSHSNSAGWGGNGIHGRCRGTHGLCNRTIA